MLRILVTGENSEEGLRELRKFEAFLNREFIIRCKARVKCIKICCYKVKGTRINSGTTDRLYNNNSLLQDADDLIPVEIQNLIDSQSQSNIIHQANLGQGVNLIYAVDTVPR